LRLVLDELGGQWVGAVHGCWRRAVWWVLAVTGGQRRHAIMR